MNRSVFSQKRAQRAQLLDKIEDLKRCDAQLFGMIIENIGPLSQWPLHNLSQMLSSHLTYQPRINLTLFVLANQCPPNLYAEWCVSRNMLKDKAAHLHVANLIKDHKAGQLTRFTSYLLPFRVTAAPKPFHLRKHPWDGVGDPMPRNAPADAFIFPVETPAMMETDGWRWDQAYALLTNQLSWSTAHGVGKLPLSRSMPEVKIVEQCNEGLTDMYGMPLDTDEFLEEHMEMQVHTVEWFGPDIKRPNPVKSEGGLTEAVKKSRYEAASVAEFFE